MISPISFRQTRKNWNSPLIPAVTDQYCDVLYPARCMNSQGQKKKRKSWSPLQIPSHPPNQKFPSKSNLVFVSTCLQRNLKLSVQNIWLYVGATWTSKDLNSARHHGTDFAAGISSVPRGAFKSSDMRSLTNVKYLGLCLYSICVLAIAYMTWVKNGDHAFWPGLERAFSQEHYPLLHLPGCAPSSPCLVIWCTSLRISLLTSTSMPLMHGYARCEGGNACGIGKAFHGSWIIWLEASDLWMINEAQWSSLCSHRIIVVPLTLFPPFSLVRLTFLEQLQL